jgi:hypothetical protein
MDRASETAPAPLSALKKRESSVVTLRDMNDAKAPLSWRRGLANSAGARHCWRSGVTWPCTGQRPSPSAPAHHVAGSRLQLAVASEAGEATPFSIAAAPPAAMPTSAPSPPPRAASGARGAPTPLARAAALREFLLDWGLIVLLIIVLGATDATKPRMPFVSKAQLPEYAHPLLPNTVRTAQRGGRGGLGAAWRGPGGLQLIINGARGFLMHATGRWASWDVRTVQAPACM